MKNHLIKLNTFLIASLLSIFLSVSCNKEDESINPVTGTEVPEEVTEEEEQTETGEEPVGEEKAQPNEGEEAEPDAEEQAVCLVTKGYNNSYYIQNFQYNSFNKAEKITYTDENGKLEDYATYSYNSEGKVEEVHFFSADGVSSRYLVVDYNTEGFVSRINTNRRTIRDNVSVVELSSYQLYDYDTQNRLIRVEEYIGETDEIELYYTFDEFDEVGNFLKASFYYYTNGEAELRGIHEYTYDDKPNIYASLGGFVYGYDVFTATPNNIVKVIANDKDGNPSLNGEGVVRNFEYNEQGYPVKKIDEYDISPGEQHMVFYEYDCK